MPGSLYMHIGERGDRGDRVGPRGDALRRDRRDHVDGLGVGHHRRQDGLSFARIWPTLRRRREGVRVWAVLRTRTPRIRKLPPWRARREFAGSLSEQFSLPCFLWIAVRRQSSRKFPPQNLGRRADTFRCSAAIALSPHRCEALTHRSGRRHSPVLSCRARERDEPVQSVGLKWISARRTRWPGEL